MNNLIEQAVQYLQRGELVAFPTETVYGLGADAKNAAAVAKVFAAKGRPANNPLIVHIASYDQLTEWASEVPDTAHLLAQAFWPGPLTLVLPKQAGVLSAVTGGQATVAVRMPRHPLALKLLQAFGSGLVAPSANRYTRISPTTAAAVHDELGESVSMILDGGACEVGLESTIIDLSQAQPRLLRPGMLSVQAIEEVLQEKVLLPSAMQNKVVAPGSHFIHYAPNTKTRLVASDRLLELVHAIDQAEKVAVLTHSQMSLPKHMHVIHMPDNAADYAQALYDTLRQLDQQQFSQIIIEDVPQEAKWQGIADRIFKASASRRV